MNQRFICDYIISVDWVYDWRNHNFRRLVYQEWSWRGHWFSLANSDLYKNFECFVDHEKDGYDEKHLVSIVDSTTDSNVFRCRVATNCRTDQSLNNHFFKYLNFVLCWCECTNQSFFRSQWSSLVSMHCFYDRFGKNSNDFSVE